jgi:hypothetical protein
MGYSANISKTDDDKWAVHVNITRRWEHSVNPESESLIDYTGHVYCIEVPSHIFYVRRNGIPVWTGNSSKHGQKGTMGMLLDAQDMPRTAEGMVPDIIVNPHCIPSRMTIAQLLEQLFGKMGAIMGAKMNATAFMNEPGSYKSIGDALESLGFQRDGEEILYSGITGRMFTTSVFMGPLYFMRLKHLTQDKLNARAKGRKELRTHQPTGGRGNEGGMRIGEMERDSLLGHGITEFLHESMMKRSDGDTIWICNGCGTIPIYNEDQNLFVCSLCDGPLTYQGETIDTLGLVLPVKKSRTTFSKIEVPYALKLLEQELTTFANISFRFLTAKNVRAFRPLPMPSEVPEETLVNTFVEAVETMVAPEPEPVTAVVEPVAPAAAENVKVIKLDEGPTATPEIAAPPAPALAIPAPPTIPSLTEGSQIGGGRPLTNAEIDAMYDIAATQGSDTAMNIQVPLGPNGVSLGPNGNGDSSLVLMRMTPVTAPLSGGGLDPRLNIVPSTPQVFPAPRGPVVAAPTLPVGTSPDAPAPAPAPVPAPASAPTPAPAPAAPNAPVTPPSDIKTIKIDVPM